MQYRSFGSSGWKVSALGFGCMRLPTLDGAPQSERIDEVQTLRMIRLAIDRGVNYVDTAYPYHNGASETVLGRALRDGYRAKVKLVTKSPVWMIKQAADFDVLLDAQLKRLGTDHLDDYLLHALNASRWKAMLDLGVLPRAEAAVKDGRIGGLGFSFHDRYEVFRDILNGYDRWALCQIQYNYLDIENQAGTKGLKDAAAKGIPVVVMEPLLGGRLSKPPQAVREAFDGFPVKRTPSEWALQWVWDKPEASVLLSGMSTIGQVEENLESAGRSGVHSLTAEEAGLIDRVRLIYRDKVLVPCTNCGYCLPCPSGVNIPQNFELYNDGFIHESPVYSRAVYARFLTAEQRANACTQCGVCLEKCPQNIAIGDELLKVNAVLGEGRPYEKK
jgi:hypothetical protein